MGAHLSQSLALQLLVVQPLLVGGFPGVRRLVEGA